MEDNMLLAVVLVPVLAMLVLLILLVLLVLLLPSVLLVLVDKIRDKGRLEKKNEG
jgi:hypothetical protein